MKQGEESPQKPQIAALQGQKNDWVRKTVAAGANFDFYPAKPELFSGSLESVDGLFEDRMG